MSPHPPAPAVIFQCSACRSLIGAGRIVLDEGRQRAALVCDACGAASWLPLGERGHAEVVDVEPAPRRSPVRELPSAAAVPLATAGAPQDAGRPVLVAAPEPEARAGSTSTNRLEDAAPPSVSTSFSASSTPSPSTSSSVASSTASSAASSAASSSSPSTPSSADAPSAPGGRGADVAAADGAALSPTASVVARSDAGGLTGAQKERLLARLEKAAPNSDGQRDLAQSFLRLLDEWERESDHKQFLKKASTLNELAFAGARYRAFLAEVPGDVRAKAAQDDILTFAMASLSRQRDLGRADEKAGKNSVLTALIAFTILGVVLLFLPDLLRGLRQAATIETPAD